MWITMAYSQVSIFMYFVYRSYSLQNITGPASFLTCLLLFGAVGGWHDDEYSYNSRLCL